MNVISFLILELKNFFWCYCLFLFIFYCICESYFDLPPYTKKLSSLLISTATGHHLLLEQWSKQHTLGNFATLETIFTLVWFSILAIFSVLGREREKKHGKLSLLMHFFLPRWSIWCIYKVPYHSNIWWYIIALVLLNAKALAYDGFL